MVNKLAKADEIKIAVIAGICIIGQALLFKYLFHIKPDTISSNGPVYLVIIYLITRGKAKDSKRGHWLWWSLGIVLITVLTIVIHVM